MSKYEERKCSECIHAHRTDDITYECDAVEYDIDKKTCFVSKKADSTESTKEDKK